MNNTDIIKNNFSRYANRYDSYCEVQDYAGKKLIDTLGQNHFARILDIGCGTGNFTTFLRDKFPDAAITALDISADMINVAQSKIPPDKIDFITADAQTATFSNNFDLIASNACFQWLGDLEATLARFKEILTTEGVILFSTFGPKTFRQLSQSLSQLHQKDVPISSTDFISSDTIEQILKKHFDRVSVVTQMIDKTYNSLLDLLNTIKYTGTRGAGIEGISLPRHRLTELEKVYKQEFKTIVATYQVFYCRAEKRN